MPERLASFALCEAEGWLLLALASRLAFFRLADGELRWLHDIEPGLPTRCNDGACDRQGRFVFATLHESREGPPQPMGGLWRLGLDLELERLPLPAVAIGNSIAFSPDGGVLYYCDSPTRRIQCCPYGDALGAPRLFVELDDGRGVPDGSCVDSQGHLWNAQWGPRTGGSLCARWRGTADRHPPHSATYPPGIRWPRPGPAVRHQRTGRTRRRRSGCSAPGWRAVPVSSERPGATRAALRREPGLNARRNARQTASGAGVSPPSDTGADSSAEFRARLARFSRIWSRWRREAWRFA
ncbi:gluconolactonase [Pseudomonas aeruginosa]|nr:gluconolactonase [Pseudomonas aeruginosa]